jgi:N utilization substance protein B
MGKRRVARELALRALFQMDLAGLDPTEAMNFTFSQSGNADSTINFARQLVLGSAHHREHIDAVIAEYATGWTLERMANVDRNVLRLAVFEILYLPDIPPSVTIDEAVEIAKTYSTAESGRFVNGILGNLLRTLQSEDEEAEPQ